jgi:hypothetical protein
VGLESIASQLCEGLCRLFLGDQPGIGSKLIYSGDISNLTRLNLLHYKHEIDLRLFRPAMVHR